MESSLGNSSVSEVLQRRVRNGSLILTDLCILCPLKNSILWCLHILGKQRVNEEKHVRLLEQICSFPFIHRIRNEVAG